MAFTTLSCVCLVAILGAALGGSKEDLESCRKSEYGYRVMEELVYLKLNQTRLLGTTAALTARLQEATTTISNLQTVVGNLQSSVSSSQSTYIRWGRTSCPASDTDLVYSGYAAGSRFNHPGGAAEYLCMPQDPQWSDTESSGQDRTGLLYGVEYEYVSQQETLFGSGTQSPLANHEVPCAVCMTSSKTTLMIPGRNTCYDGWNAEYRGYLGSGHYAFAGPSSYICVDESPEVTSGSSTSNHDGKLVYMVEAKCGSLPCPPYVESRELTCVVCSME